MISRALLLRTSGRPRPWPQIYTNPSAASAINPRSPKPWRAYSTVDPGRKRLFAARRPPGLLPDHQSESKGSWIPG